MPDILHLININASPARVYRALTTAEGIHAWWTRDADLDSNVGGTGEFRFYDGKGITQVRIDTLKPQERVVWKTIAANAPGGWEGTTIAFDLSPEEEGTVLSFAHTGFKQAGEDYALVNMGWAYYLVSLQQYLETGRGMPQQDKDFARVLCAAGVRTTDIVHDIEIDTTPDRLFDAITTQQGLAGWWTPRAKAEPRIGAVNEFHFEPETTLRFRVDKLEPARHVSWSGVEVPADWQGTQLKFDITPAGKSVNLRFSHVGFPTPYEHVGAFSYLWGQYVRSLKLFVETGKGEPFGSPSSRAAGTTPRWLGPEI